jgi:hypothetical protein
MTGFKDSRSQGFKCYFFKVGVSVFHQTTRLLDPLDPLESFILLPELQQGP